MIPMQTRNDNYSLARTGLLAGLGLIVALLLGEPS